MRNYRSTEDSLKRFLKRKVKITMGFVVAFMIMGTGVFGEEIEEHTNELISAKNNLIAGYRTGNSKVGTEIKNENLGSDLIDNLIIKGTNEVDTEEQTLTKVSGVYINPGVNLFVQGKNIEISAINKNNGGYARGITFVSAGSYNDTTAKLGNENTELINIVIESTGEAIGIINNSNDNHASLNIEGKILNINVKSSDINRGQVSGIQVSNNTSDDIRPDKATKIEVNSEKTIIVSDYAGISAYSNGVLKINGDLEINAKVAVSARGNSCIRINESQDKTIKLNGDVEFNYHENSSGTGINSDVLINLSNKDSEFTGKIVKTGNPPEGKDTVNGMKLGLLNGGTWNNRGDSFVNNLTLNGGIINSTENNIDVDSFKISGKENKITAKEFSVKNNVIIDSETSLESNGIFKVNGNFENSGEVSITGGEINIGADSEFINKDGAIINVSSEATMVTGGGTAVNSGTINLADTDNSDGTISKLLNGGTLSNQGVIALKDKTGTMSDEDWNELLSQIITGEGKFTNSGMIVDSESNTIFADGTIISEDTAVENIADNSSIKIENDKNITISGTEEEKLSNVTINADGNLTLAGKDENAGTGAGVVVDKESEINVAKDKIVTVTGTDNKLDGTVNLIDNGKLEITENSQATISGTVAQSSGEGGSVVNKGDLVIEKAEIQVGITTDENTSTGKVTIIDSTVEEVKANEIQVGENEISDNFWNMFNGTKKISFFADNTETENSHSVINKDIISDTSLFISEDSIYNGNVTVNGTADKATLAVMDSVVEFNENVTVKNKEGIFIGGDKGSSIKFGGNVTADKISFAGTSEVYYSADSTLVNNAGTEGTVINGGKNIFEVADNGKNALLNTSNAEGIKTGVTVKGSEILLDVNLTKDEVIDLGEKSVIGRDNTVALTENSETFYKLTEMGENKYKFTYKDDLASENGYSSELNEIFKNSQTIHDVLNKSGYDTVHKRAGVLDKYYSANIYSETVKAAYDNIKLNEETALSLGKKSEIGKWTAEGKALYSKNEYDRNGVVGDYSSEIESTGLLAGFGYGINETAAVGIAFSGVKQDVDTDSGSADADLFYFGVYGNKIYGNYDLTAGLGCQFGEYEADNNILGTAEDKYDSQSVSGYVQGRYIKNLGDGLSVQPKVKLGYIYVKQDDTKDSCFGAEDAEISTFDAEAGFDVVKSIYLTKSKLDVNFGVSYIKTMGDTDKEFTGRFYGETASGGFDVLGAELAENIIKFNLGAELTSEKGFFCNGGLTYEFGSNDTETYGINVGVGYKF